MKQLTHSPEAAAALLGVSIKIAHERIAILRKHGRSPTCGSSATTPPDDYVRLTRWKPATSPL